MKEEKKYNIAIIGATGNVGYELLKILDEKNFPFNNIHALASRDSLGKEVSCGDRILKIEALEFFDFQKVQIVFSTSGDKISEEYVPKAVSAGAIVIDNTAFFRNNPRIPLLIPEVNPNDLKLYTDTKIIANPNCCVIPIALALKPLDNLAKIKRIIVTTYQSVSGAGKAAMDELYQQTKKKYVFGNIETDIFPRQIAFNIIPQIGSINEDYYTEEEQKITDEITKIMGSHIKSSATCVRVPVFVGHCMAINVEFEKNISVDETYHILEEADGLRVLLPEQTLNYATPLDVVGEDEVIVCRIRQDHSQKNTLNMWLVADNIRKGAALNAVQIAEMVIQDL